MEEKNKVLDFLTPGCSQQCNVICQNLTVNEASEVSHFLISQTGVPPSPCFPIFLARTTFVLESLPEAKNPGQDAFLGDFVFNSSYSRDNSLLD